MEKTMTWTNFYSHPRFWRHAIPWTLCLGFLFISTYIIEVSEGNPKAIENDQKVFLVLAEMFFLIYASFYVYNRFYKREGKKAWSIILIVLIIVATAYVDHVTNTNVIQLGEVEGFLADIVLFPILILVAFGLKMAYHGSRQLFVIERLQAKQTESELELLKSQVNPHFLFNTLNNIYSTNLENHEKANEIILELSDLLRYQLESNKSTFTPLFKEVKNLENYIDLERIRVFDCEINLKKSGNFEKVEIIPLLLLPFVENAFKYGTGIEAGKIDLSMDLSEKRVFTFICRNKIVQKKGKVHTGGIGLDNVKKRLALMYQNKHELSISQEGNHFKVHLKIQL